MRFLKAGFMSPTLPLPGSAVEFLPHKPPMCCIDLLVACDETQAESESLLTEDHIFMVNGVLASAGLIEMAAQTAGAMQGYLALARERVPPQGMLVGVQHFVFSTLARAGDLLRISVIPLATVQDVTILQATITCADTTIAHGGLKVYVPGNAR